MGDVVAVPFRTQRATIGSHILKCERVTEPLSSQAIGMLLRNRLYIDVIDVPDFGGHDQRGDFDPCISEEIFRKSLTLSGVGRTRRQIRISDISRISALGFHQRTLR